MRLRRFLILAFVWALPLAALGSAGARADAEGEISRGNDAFAQRNYTQAITYFSNALKQGGLSNNRRAYVFLRRGRAYYGNKQFQQAIADHREAVRLNPQYHAAYWNLGLDYQAIRKYGEAADAHSQAIRIKPNFYQAFIDRGNCFLNMQEYREALRDYETALAIRPNYAIGWNNRGVAYARLGNKAEAARSYRRALQLDPDYKLARENLTKLEQGR